MASTVKSETPEKKLLITGQHKLTLEFFVPDVWEHLSVPHTLVHHVKSEDGTVVAVLLFRVLGETDVISLILKGDVPQQDGDVVVLGRADKLHTVVFHFDLGLHPLDGNHRVA